jgi:hypothetical protein
MHTSSGAAYGRGDDAGDAPVSSFLENKENPALCQQLRFGSHSPRPSSKLSGFSAAALFELNSGAPHHTARGKALRESLASCVVSNKHEQQGKSQGEERSHG